MVPPALSGLSRLPGWDNWEGVGGDRWALHFSYPTHSLRCLPLLEAAGLHQDYLQYPTLSLL